MGGLRSRRILLAGGLAVIALVLLGSPASAQPTQGPDEPLKDGVTYEWWNDDWHMRVPVLVRPQMPDAVVDGRRPVLEDAEDVPVHAEIDFTDAIRRAADSPDAQWPQAVDGSLNSFTFDKDSVRVVRYDRETGTTVSGDAGEVVPSRFLPTLTERRDLNNGRFDASANAVGTVTWIADEALTSSRLYFVYFDIQENGDKPAPDRSPDELGALDSLHWIRPGTDLYGYVPDTQESGSPALEVYGLHEDTAVQVERYAGSGISPEPVDSCAENDAGLCVQGGNLLDDPDEPTFELEPLTASRNDRRLRVAAESGIGFFFHVEADKPVLASVRSLPPPTSQQSPSQLFYPGKQGLVSDEFTFTLLQNSPSESGPLSNLDMRVIAPQDAATVEWEYLDRGRPDDESPLSVPARGAKTIEFPDDAAGEAVRVTADGGPIAIAKPGDEPHAGTQAPTSHGAPVGEETLAPAPEHLLTTPWGSRTDLTSFSLSEPSNPDARVHGTGGPGAGNAADLHVTRDQKDFRGDVFLTSASKDGEPISTLHGDSGVIPLGGVDGRRYEVPMGDDASDLEADRLAIIPVYDRTHVRVTDNATGEVAFDGNINRDRFLSRDGQGEPFFGPPGGYSVNASKPVLAYRIQDNAEPYATYLSSVSRSPLYETGDAEFHGRLIRWDTPLRTPSLAPGQEKSFDLTLTNLGREIGGANLPDDIVIEQNVTGTGSATLSTQQVRNLDTLESRDVQLAVSIPEEAETGDKLTVNLTAVSQGNPNFRASTQVRIVVETLYRVELSFLDDDCNPDTCERLVDSGASTLYTVRVNNTGTGDDAYGFSVLGSQSGFEARIQHLNGTVIAEPGDSGGNLQVDRGEERLVALNVTAPESGSGAVPYEAVVQATSKNGNDRDQVTALTRLSVNTDFRLELDRTRRTVTPGEDATFPVRVVNEGDDAVLDVATSEPSLEGWNVSIDPDSFLVRANGTTAPDGTRGDIRTVNVTVTAAPDAEVGDILPLEVAVRSETAQASGGTETVEIRAEVANNFTVTTNGMEPRSRAPGETFRYDFSVANAANGPFEATLNATDLPDGWRYEKETPTSPTSLDVGETLDVRGELVLPAGTPAGRYNVTFTVFGVAEDGSQGLRNVTGQVQVARQVNLDVSPPSPTTPVPPGNRTRVPLEVTNVGNVDLTTELTLDSPPDWGLAFQDDEDRRFSLEVGASRTVDVVLEAPATIGTDPVEWGLSAELPLRSPQDFSFQADWIRRDLQVTDVQSVVAASEPGDVGVLGVTLRNDGNLPANDVELAVLEDGEVASNATVETLPPDGDRVVQVEWTVGTAEADRQVVVDPADRFVETDETNNAMGFTPDARSAVPAPGLAVAVLAAGAAAVARRRR